MKHSRCRHLLLALFIVAACASQTHGMNPESALPDDGRLAPTNGSGTWSVMSSSTDAWLLGTWGSGPSDVFAVGAEATIIHYNGKAWSGMNSNTNGSINGVWGNSSSNVFAIRYDPFDPLGNWGAVLNYDGVWNEIITYESSELHGISGSSSSDILIVAAAGEAFHFDGSQWLYTNPGTTADLEAVWYSSPHNAFVVGSEGTILKYTGTWNSMASGTTKWLFGVWGSSADDVFAVGESGTILHYDGVTWRSMSSGTGHWLLDVWGSSGDNVFAVGEGGTILHYDGTSWNAMASGTTTASLEGVWGSSATNVFVVGSNGIILHYSQSATTPTVTTAAVTDITTTTAQSGGDVTSDGGAAVTAKGVCWSASVNPTINDDKTDEGPGTGAFTSDITGLDPDKGYHVRAYATNEKGTAYGSDIGFTTLAEPTKPTVTTAAVTDITTTAARSGGDVTSDGGAAVTAKGVCWSPSPNPTLNDDKTDEGPGTGAFTSDITGLDPDSGYHVRAYATNEKGTAYGSDIDFTTPDAYTLYVSKDGTCGNKTPCHSTLQGAVDAADTGAVIKIAGGTYTESVILNQSKSLTLKGGWDASFKSQTSDTILRQAPKAPQGSLTLQMVHIVP